MKHLLLCATALTLAPALADAQSINHVPFVPYSVSVTESGANQATCNGVADDTANIQAVITANAGVARTMIPRSVTCIVGTLSLPSKTVLVVDGTLKLKAANNATMLNVANAADSVVAEINGTLDGNKSAQTGGTSAGVGNAGTATNVWVRGTGLITNFQNWPVNITHTTGAWMADLRMTNSGNSVEFAAGTTNCFARNLYISGIADISFAFYGGVQSCGISDSIVTGSTVAGGIGVLNDTGQPAIVQDIDIHDNIVFGHWLAGISVMKAGTGTGNNLRVNAHGNRVFNNNQSNTAAQADINFGFCTECNADNNIVGPSGNGNAGMLGIWTASTSDTVSIKGNTIINEGIGGGPAAGIQISSTPRVIVADNLIRDDGAGVMGFGITGTAGTGNQIYNNAIFGTIGEGFNITLAADTVTSQVAVNANRRLTISRSQRNSFANTIGTGTTGSATVNDETIIWASGTAGAKAQSIPTCGAGNAGQNLYIKDNQGTAGTGNITITPTSGTIDGAGTFVINANRGVARLQCDGVSNWMVM